uniref:Histidine acid phosphatase n=1 Tax=Rhabditophanes sp. KR3021 TaxID=114890 RepID=A0AC35U3T1_9BILA
MHMLHKLLILLILVSSFCLTIQEDSEHAELDQNTKLVIFATRHGNRNPSKYLDNDIKTRKWGYEGVMELNTVGKREAFGFGKKLRKFLDKFVDPNYMPSEATFMSSSASRCQMTLQTACAGLYPAKESFKWNNKLPWSPTPYVIDDNILRPYSKKNCPEVENAWLPIDKAEPSHIKKQLNDNKNVVDYVAKESGSFGFDKMKPYNEMANVADNLINYERFNLPPPLYLTNATLDDYNGPKLISKVLTFAEGPQISCADDKECGHLMGGNWVSVITTALSSRSNSKAEENIKLIGYASHTEIVLSVMKLMGVEQEEVPTGSGFVIELRDKPIWALRILKHETHYKHDKESNEMKMKDHRIEHAKYKSSLKKIAHDKQWIPLKDFVEYTSNYKLQIKTFKKFGI